MEIFTCCHTYQVFVELLALVEFVWRAAVKLCNVVALCLCQEGVVAGVLKQTWTGVLFL